MDIEKKSISFQGLCKFEKTNAGNLLFDYNIHKGEHIKFNIIFEKSMCSILFKEMEKKPLAL